jgi:hypothetical protein
LLAEVFIGQWDADKKNTTHAIYRGALSKEPLQTRVRASDKTFEISDWIAFA